MSYKWIPNAETCRPSPIVKLMKDKTIREINSKWKTLEDFVLHRIFDRPYSVDEAGKLFVRNHYFPPCFKLFRENEFPYNIPEGHHWVMWYGSEQQPCTNETITQDIDQSISSRINSELEMYDFAWYLNPKLTIPHLFHVHVFWKTWPMSDWDPYLQQQGVEALQVGTVPTAE